MVACGGKAPDTLPPPPKPAYDPAAVTWNQETQGISLRLEASPDLNHEGDRPLGVTLCVYQLDDPTTFQSLAMSADGLDQLLDCSLDAAKARASRAFRVQPGESKDFSCDRVEKARYLAVVAGYRHMHPDMCTALLPFPIHHDKEGILFRDDIYTAAPLRALIHLGPESVTVSGVERVQ
ncbi:MAG: type VI secretion system lipoprotein TssJ [Desulfovibrionaceae bacterium]|nr:type VI secretion system lipoprotein TssJ [Desulfovibrionaceae bacterium]